MLLVLSVAWTVGPGFSASPGWAAEEILPPRGDFTIVRDSFGVPHIYAETISGLFRGQGYAVAQDRLWQLELYSRTGLGTLSEVLGEYYLCQDKLTRMDGYTTAEVDSQYQALSAETRAIMEAYISGVNARMAEVRAAPDSLLPYEFWTLDITPSIWTTRHMMAVIKYLARAFGSTGGMELYMLDQLETLGPELFDETYPLNDPGAPTTIARGQHGSGGAPSGGRPERTARLARYLEGFGRRVSPAGWETLQQILAEETKVREALGLPPSFGSFGVVVAGRKSASGWAMLLGGPQTGTPQEYAAQLGVEVDLHGPSFHVSGMAIPGLPGVIVGRNRDLSWTLTSGISDNVDVYVEELNPTDPEEYLWRGEYVPFETRIDTIYTYQSPQTYLVRRSVHGPVFGGDVPAGQRFSRKRTFWGQEAKFLESLLAIDRAATLEEVEAAFSTNPVSFNVLCATASGRAGYWHTGYFQDHLDGVDPRLPHSGTGDQEWHGIRPFSSLPRQCDPLGGFYANWNNKPSAEWDNGDNMPWVGWQHVQYIINYIGPDGSVTMSKLKSVPVEIWSRGTYEQVIQLSTPAEGYNILPPGQSGFINRWGSYDPHFRDQWDIYHAWGYKSWIFDPQGGLTSVVAGGEPGSADSLAAESGEGPGLRISWRPAPDGIELAFQQEVEGRAVISIFRVDGRRIRTIEAGSLPRGSHRLSWDGRDGQGQRARPGIYFARLVVPEGEATTKLVLAP